MLRNPRGTRGFSKEQNPQAPEPLPQPREEVGNLLTEASEQHPDSQSREHALPRSRASLGVRWATLPVWRWSRPAPQPPGLPSPDHPPRGTETSFTDSGRGRGDRPQPLRLPRGAQEQSPILTRHLAGPPKLQPRVFPRLREFLLAVPGFSGIPSFSSDGGWAYQSAPPHRMGAALPLCSSIRETRVTW